MWRARGSPSTAKLWIAAIVDLYKLQVESGYIPSNTPHPRKATLASSFANWLTRLQNIKKQHDFLTDMSAGG
jgi:hypothetical protein